MTSDTDTPSTRLLRGARLVPVGVPGRATGGPVDVLVRGGRVVEVAPDLPAPPGGGVLDLDGRFLVPGLWDQHVHLTQWARTLQRVDLSGTDGPGEVARRVGAHIAALPRESRGRLVHGWGFRAAAWDERPTVAVLDAVSRDHPVVAVSGDGHSGWLNSRALELLGLGHHEFALDENEWFAAFDRLDELPGAAPAADEGYADALAGASALGVVGVVDLEFDAASGRWVDRFASGLDTLRVRTAVYPDGLGRVVGEGRRTGDAWDGGGGLLTMGPLKVITDGSLGTRTAHCCEPYPGALAGDAPHGKQNVPPEELHDLLATATGHGLRVALHAIGDAAVAIALRAFEATGARGSIEHAQLTTTDQIATMARLGVRASVQPAHLLEDRDLVPRCWPGREDRCFRLRSMLDAGVDVALGSDAPVSPLDPWLEMAVAVHRSGDDRPPWVPGQAITAAEALAASTDGWGTVAAGHPADLVALDRDPLGAPVDDTAAAAALLRDVPVALTLVAGRTVHDAR